MRINVRQVDGSFAVLDVDPTSSFGDLKALISGVSGIEASELTIVCGGAAASDEQRLLDACVTEHTALTIVTAFGGVIEDLQSQLSAKAMLPSGGDGSERPLLEAGAFRRQQGRALAEANAAAAAGIREQVADVTRAMARGLAATAAATSASPAAESVFTLPAMAEDDLLPADAVAVMDAIPGLHLLLPCGACTHVVLHRGATAAASIAASGSASLDVTLGEEQPIAALRKAAAAASGLPGPNTALLLRGRTVPHAFDAGVRIGQLGLSPDGSTVVHVAWQPAPLAESAALAVSETRPRGAALQAAAQAFGLSSNAEDARAPQAGPRLSTSDEGLLEPSCAYGNTAGGRLHAHCACCGVAGAHMAAVPLCPCCLSEAATQENADVADRRTAATAATAGASGALSVVITRGTLPPGDGDGVDAGAAQAAGAYTWGSLLALCVACARCGYAGPAEVGFACRAVTVAAAGAAAAAAPGANSGAPSSRACRSDMDVSEEELLAAAALVSPASAAGPRIRRCPSKPVTLSALLPAQGPSSAGGGTRRGLDRDLSLPSSAGTRATADGAAAPIALDAGIAASLVGGSAGSAALAEEDPLGVADGRAGGGLTLGGAGATADPSLCALGTDEASRALRLTAQAHALLSFPLGGAGVDEVTHLPLAVRPTS
jgi:hypothetical protein